jgi:hypothetical protein
MEWIAEAEQADDFPRRIEFVCDHTGDTATHLLAADDEWTLHVKGLIADRYPG